MTRANVVVVSAFAWFRVAYSGYEQMLDTLCGFQGKDGANATASMRAQSNPLAVAIMENLDGYGCWCYFDDNHVNGRGKPVNEIDEFCKILHDGYECAKRDSRAVGDTCVPWEVHYFAPKIGSIADIQSGCETENSDSPAEDYECALRACIIETHFVTSLLFHTMAGGQLDIDIFGHQSDFTPEIGCPSTGGQSEVECCGTYPLRFPYNKKGGERDCCGDQTYSTVFRECCADGELKATC